MLMQCNASKFIAYLLTGCRERPGMTAPDMFVENHIYCHMKKTKILFWTFSCIGAMFAAVSCTEKLVSPETAGTEPAVESKLIFTSENAAKGSLLVFFTDEAVKGIENTVMTRSGDGPATRSGIDGLDSVLEEAGVKSIERLFPVDEKNEERTRAAGLHRWYVVKFDMSADLDRLARAMAAFSEISNVEFCHRMEKAAAGKAVPLSESGTGVIERTDGAAFNDPYIGNQWHYINTGNTSIYSGIREGADVRCEDAWKLCTGDPRVIVAVVDDCVQWDHPDLAANMWTNEKEIAGNGIDDDGNGFIDDVHGFNFVNNTVLTVSSGTEGAHGTHVAGTVAAVNNNSTGVCGIAGGSGNGDGVKIMSCQIFHDEDENNGSTAITARAIKYAADNGAAILQCSFGYDAGIVTSDDAYTGAASAEKQAIDYFIASRNCEAVSGGIVIFAAGNEMTGMSAYPGAYRDYISVTGISCDYTPAYYTNYGPGCNIAAPGGDVYQSYFEDGTEGSQVLSTINGGRYGYMQGTSMACPHVSGIAALGLSYALQTGRNFTRDEFNSLLLTSVNDINPYCTGTKQYVNDSYDLATLDCSRFRGLMGTGYIDAFQVLMNVRGITCIPVSPGGQTQIDIRKYIGDGSPQITVTGVAISEDARESLGISSDPVLFGGNILVRCSKTGSGIMTVSFRAGTDSGNGISGMTVTKEFALIARTSHSENGGWL